jgi:hypothetical protein
LRQQGRRFDNLCGILVLVICLPLSCGAIRYAH